VTNVRPGRLEDMEGLLAIEEESRRSGTSPWFVLDEDFFSRKMAQGELLVDEDVTGYLAWTRIWRLPWVEFVRVREATRRKGIGKALMRGLEDQLRAAGGYMVMSSSASTDGDAIAWHRAIGFVDGGRIEWRAWRGAPPEVLHYKELSAGN
jgi:ribosomal protein S18 acetylase RimI-like enzyme